MQCCIVLSKRDADKIKKLAKDEGKDSVQRFMTEKALEVINTEFTAKGEDDKSVPFQFRLDATLHKMIKEKASTLNRDMSDLFKEVIFKEAE